MIFFPLLTGIPNNKLMLYQLPQLNSGFFLLVMSIQTCDMVLVFQSCLTLCSPMDRSLPGSSVLGVLQAQILEWVAVPSSRGSSSPRDLTWVSRIAGRFSTVRAYPQTMQLQDLNLISSRDSTCYSAARVLEIKKE